MLQIFADGSVSKNGQPDAIAGSGTVVTLGGKVIYKVNRHLAAPEYPPYQSNNTGELWGVIDALSLLPKPLEVELVSDSSYVIDTMRLKRYETWEKNGWYTSNLTRVANQSLWKQVIELSKQHSIVWTHIKGHQDTKRYKGIEDQMPFIIKMNVLADNLAGLGKQNVLVAEGDENWHDQLLALPTFVPMTYGVEEVSF